MRKNAKRIYSLAFLWALTILFLSVIPSRSLKTFHWKSLIAMDKLGHFGVYAILCFLLIIGSWLQKEGKSQKYAIINGVILSFLYGFLMEVLQYGILEDRNFEVLDLIANIIGSFTGVLGFYIFKNKLKWMLH